MTMNFPCLGRRENGSVCETKVPNHQRFCDNEDCVAAANYSILPHAQVVISDLRHVERMVLRDKNDVGITHIVSVCPMGTVWKYVVQAIKLAEIQHLVIPIQDDSDENILYHIPAAVRWILKAIKQNPKNHHVVIHCEMGISRSVTIGCALVMHMTGSSPEDALHHVKWKRREANPNPGFRRQLQSYAHVLQHANARHARKLLFPIFPTTILDTIYSYSFTRMRIRKHKDFSDFRS